MSAAELNPAVLSLLAELAFAGTARRIEVGDAGAVRALEVRAGSLTTTSSTFQEDHLADLLAAQGRLDPALIAPMGEAAKVRGIQLGELLCAQGLLSYPELVPALERYGQELWIVS